MFADFGWTHALILGGILFLVFGARRIPEIGRNVGTGINNLFRGVKGAFEDDPPALPPARDKDKLSE
jgi:TatA/E family protein of Tat protein translocase